MKKLSLFFLFALTLFDMSVRGQGIDDSHRPNASKGNVGKNTVNVDPFSGTANVNIPIYDFNVSNLHFPISIAYNAKGIRVDEIASSVGLGWNLLTGSTITREVKGLEDEVTLPAVHKNDTTDHYEGYLVPGSHAVGYTGQYFDDTTADIFYVNLGGRNLELSFIKDSYGNITYKTFPKSEITVSIYTKDWRTSPAGYTNSRNGVVANMGIKGADSNFLSFVIVDENGNTFNFERGDSRLKEYDLDSAKLKSYKGSYWSVENWKLVKVTTFEGKVIDFSYDRKYVQYLESITETLYFRAAILDTNNNIVFDPVEIKKQTWKGYKTHIKTINYPNNTVAIFGLDTSRADCFGNYQLAYIIIKNCYTESIDNFVYYDNHIEYDFHQFMFNTPYHGANKKIYPELDKASYYSKLHSNTSDSLINIHYERGLRLGLGSITRKGTDNTSTEPYYFFTYDTTYTFPYRLAPNKDYYGYYNGGSNTPCWRQNPKNSSIVDTFYLSVPYRDYNGIADLLNYSNGQSFGQDRSFSAVYAKTNSLVKITNGCYGSDSLVFTDYTLVNPDSAYGIDTIPHVPGPGYDLTVAIDAELDAKTENDGLCVQKIISKDGFSADNTTQKKYDYHNSGIRFNQGGYMWYVDPLNVYNRVYTNYFVDPALYLNGSNHGFSQVSATTLGYNNDKIDSTKYYYSNLMYVDANSNYKSCIEKSTGIQYHFYLGTFDKWRMGNLLKAESYDPYGFKLTSTEMTYEEVSNYGMRIKTQNSTGYITDRAASSIISVPRFMNYEYDTNDNVIKTQTLVNLYDTLTTLTTYGTNQHIIATETWTNLTGGTYSTAVLTGASITPVISLSTGVVFPYTFSSALKTPLSYSDGNNSSFINRACSTYNGTTPSSFGSNLKLTTKVTQFDSANNFVEVQKNNRDEYSAAIWDIKTGNKLAEAFNAHYADIAYTSFDGMFKPYCPGCSPSQTSLDHTKGNWEFYTADIVYYTNTSFGSSVTGAYVYELKSGNYLRSQELNDKSYLLTFWMVGDTLPTIGIYNGSSLVTAVTPIPQVTIGSWTLYRTVFTSSSGNRLKFTSSSSKFIDEVRLHPYGATMKTYTYSPLFGVSSVSDVNNYITYYDYSPFGMLMHTRDMRKNIVTKVVSKCSSNDLPSEGGGSIIPESDNNTSTY